MRVAIEILSTRFEPGASNIEAIKRTYISLANELEEKGLLEHQYDFFFYYGGYTDIELDYDKTGIHKDSQYNHCFDINLPVDESIYDTFEKGILALQHTPNYDWYVRVNISCYLNIPLLDKVISQFDKDTVYCNAINSYINDEHYYNHLYPRGDMMIFSEITKEGILNNYRKYYRCDTNKKNRINIPHTDDCMFGLCLMNYFGDTYFEHLQMLHYNYMPDPKESIEYFNSNCIGNRVKTIPPGIKYSGYSWEDNEYRRFDVKKMESMNEKIKTIEYNNVKLTNLYSNAKPTLFISLSNQPIEVFHKYLNKIRGVK